MHTWSRRSARETPNYVFDEPESKTHVKINLGIVTSQLLAFFDHMMATVTTPKAAQLIVVIDTSALEPSNC